MNKDTKLCMICGDTKEHPLSPLCMKCAPYFKKGGIITLRVLVFSYQKINGSVAIKLFDLKTLN